MSVEEPLPRASRPMKPLRRTRTKTTLPQPEHVRHPPSSKSGIVFFLGEAGCGKSRTLNLLFGSKYKEISPVSPSSGTRDILEFRAVSPVDNLRIIDVPGLAKSLKLDAQILASLKKFMDADPELSHHIPHVVVITTRFDQSKRLGHPNSNFVRTLRAIHLLRARLLHEFNSNLVVVLTHFMNGKRRHRVYSQPYLDKVTQVVRLHLGISYSPYLVPAENEAEEYNLLPMRENFRLTNGALYPENLIHAVLSVVKNSKSSISYDYFNFLLQNRHHLVFEPGPAIPYVDQGRKLYQKFLEALLTSAMATTV